MNITLIIFYFKVRNPIESSKNLMSIEIDSDDDEEGLSALEIFVNKGRMAKPLKSIASSLLTISPTSTCVERCFSSCGNVMTPLRATIKPDLIEAMIIGRYFFLNEDKYV